MKNFLIVILSILVIRTANAQNSDTVRNICQKGNYVTFAVGGGLHSLAYKMDHDDNNRDSRTGFSLEAGFQHFISPNWGIATGLIARFFTTKTVFNYSYSAFDTDTDNEDYEHITIFEDFWERQTMMNLGLPLLGIYQREIGSQWRWTASAGLKLSTQIYSKSKRTSGQIETQGYFDEYHLLLYGMENHWFMNYYDMKARFKSNIQLSALCETNLNYVLKRNPRLELSIGLYGEYNLNNTHKVNDMLHFDYSTDTYNGALNTAEVNKVHPFAIGTKFGIRYRLGSSKTSKPVEPDKPVEPEPVEPENPTDSPEPEPTNPFEPLEPLKPENPVEPITPPSRTKHIVINFEFDQTFQIYSGDIDLLDDIAMILKANPLQKITITGHTDNFGSYEYNYKLGMRRAQVVKDELVKLGVDPQQIDIQSKSYSEPLVPNDSPENRYKNRRVEIVY